MSEQPDDRARLDRARARAVAALDDDRADYSFTYACGLRVRDRRYEAHRCSECAGPVRPDEEPTP